MIANRFDTTEAAPKLTANLTRDLMDPGLSALDLCDYHDLKLNQLDELCRSPQFEQLKSCIARIAAARLELIELDAQPRALGALLETTRLPQEDQKSTETVRKASTRLLPRASGGGARKAGGGGLAHTTSPTQRPTTNPSPPPRLRGRCHDEVVTEGVFSDFPSPSPRVPAKYLDEVMTEGVFPEHPAPSPRVTDSVPHLPPTRPFPSAQPPFPARIPGLIASAGLPATFAQTP